MFWYLQYLYASGSMHAYHTQHTGVARFQWTTFSEREPLSIPSLPIQRRIASILSAYDDLIENSQRRIKILESMARALYREWFIHFRFPGHENHPRVASALGEIPEGWEAIRFERLLASMTGGDWGSEHPEDRETEAVVVVRGTDFDEVAYGGQLRAPVRYIKPSSLVSRALKVGDVIIENSINAKSRSVGTTLLVDKHVLNRLGQDAIAASFCKVLRPHDQMIAPLIHLHARHLREDARMEYYQNVAANGIANFQAQKFAKEEHLVLPADEDERSRLIAPIRAVLQNVASLASRLANLRRTRDLLLPRLLSGHIALDELEAA
jgi:type I restriction enzyme S subunit